MNPRQKALMTASFISIRPKKVDVEFETIIKAKKARIQEKIEAGDFNFEGAKLVDFSANRMELSEANFDGTTFSGDA